MKKFYLLMALVLMAGVVHAENTPNFGSRANLKQAVKLYAEYPQQDDDQQNGTYYDNGTDYPEWVGCPLIVHRRCISPMYDISNSISYNGNMKQQTNEPSEEKTKNFIKKSSQWINVIGAEEGNGDHYVSNQGEIVCKMVNEAFKRSKTPSLFIITPFTSTINIFCPGCPSWFTTSSMSKRSASISCS